MGTLSEFGFAIFWDDLTDLCQQELLDYLGDNGNFDVVPIAVIGLDERGRDGE